MSTSAGQRPDPPRAARLLLGAALVAPAVLLAQAPSGSPAPASGSGPALSLSRPAGRAAREEWNGMTPEDRKRMRETYEQLLRDLPPQKREQLLARLRGMSPEERRELIEAARARVRDRESERQEERRRELERLPPEERERE